MIGVIANALAIAVLAFCGAFIGNRIPEKVQRQILIVLPLSVMIMGIQMGMEADAFVVVILSLALGTGIGAALDVDGAFLRFGERVDKKIAKSQLNSGGEGPMAAAIQSSLLFCVGSMAIVGALQAGMNGNPETLIVKSVLDGMTALVFASTMGIGVALSAIPTLIYEGLIVLLSSHLAPFISDALVADLTSVGGIMILAIGFGLMEIKDIRVANMLPSFVVVILARAVMSFWM